MSGLYDDIIRRHCRPLKPILTSVSSSLQRLPDIRVVLFDIYGTLLISASGDIASGHAQAQGEAFEQAVACVGLRLAVAGNLAVQVFHDVIEANHQQARAAGVAYPEVEIVSVWRRALQALHNRAMIDVDTTSSSRALATHLAHVDLHRLAIEYEMRVNPVWPMPHVSECLKALRASHVTTGLVSNAQFLTIEIWRMLLDDLQCRTCFDEQLQYYSYRIGRAKPGADLFHLAARDLADRAIPPSAVLYVGNDLLNDVAPARSVGFRTALFAGDARSLRLREGDARVAGVASDLIVNDLMEIPRCILG